MAHLLTGVAFIAALFLFTSAPSYAQEPSSPTVSPGFAQLLETGRRTVGAPLASERAGDNMGSTLVPTSTGMLYWEPGIGPSWTNGYDRLTLDESGQLVAWQSPDQIKPPPKEPEYFIAGVHSPALYIEQHSRYGWRAVCVSRIETGSWTAYYNPQPWGGGQHAQGFFGWLPSTWYGPLISGHPELGTVGQGGSIMNLDDEIRGFDRMLDARRGTEFFGISSHVC